ncbi:MAG TPA: S41 family peptidase [Steroidobacteraceae bacterium]|nr:S41 family peptidase [Steroidobacteraceae bacterium]
MSIKVPTVLALAVGVALGVSLSLSRGVLADRESPRDQKESLPWEDARLLAEVLERVKRDYVERVDDHALMENAVRGMLSALDPHSAFLDNNEYDEIRVSTTGAYSGVGIEVMLESDVVKVVAAMEGTPAARAGIRAGDIITAIDGMRVDTTGLTDAINRMRGKAGTSVRVEVTRTDAPAPIEFVLERSNVQVHSVKHELLEPGFGYVRITHFSETTGADLNKSIEALREASPDGIRGLVLDLRNNPGGVLEAAVTVSDAFLNDGVIVTASGRAPDSRFEMDATPGDLIEGAEMIVLVNSGSASASEIVAGALKDHGRAMLMGRTTFGKGSVQTVMPLSDGRAIKLTTSRYFTPSGASIHEKGIVPDVIVERDPAAVPLALPAEATLAERDNEIALALTRLKQDEPIQQSQVQPGTKQADR